MKKIAIILSIILISACTTKMGYNFLDFGLRWQIKSYVSLKKHQKSIIWEKIDEFHQWHRDTQLTSYANYLEKTYRHISENDVSGEWVHSQTDELQLMVEESISYLLPTIANSLADMNDKQTKQLISNLSKDVEEYKKESIFEKNKKTFKKREEELSQSLSYVVGKLNREQKKWLQEWSRSLIPFEELSYQQQLNWLEQFTVTLKTRKNDPDFAKKVKLLLIVDSDQWDPELDKIMDKNQNLTYKLIAKIFNNLDDKQQKKMDKKLSGYIKDFRELAKGN